MGILCEGDAGQRLAIEIVGPESAVRCEDLAQQQTVPVRRDAWLRPRGRLREGGLEPIQYIYPNTYIVWGRGADRSALQREKSIRWTGDFAPAYRVQPRWRDLGEEVRHTFTHFHLELTVLGAETAGLAADGGFSRGKLSRRVEGDQVRRHDAARGRPS